MTRQLSIRLAGALLAAALAIGACACAKKPLPEKGTYAEQIYANRCGQCHQPYQPQMFTSGMWQLQVKLMQGRMEQAGMPALSPGERETILSYLKRHAGTD